MSIGIWQVVLILLMLAPIFTGLRNWLVAVEQETQNQ